MNYLFHCLCHFSFEAVVFKIYLHEFLILHLLQIFSLRFVFKCCDDSWHPETVHFHKVYQAFPFVMFPPLLFNFSAHKNSTLLLPVEGRRVGTGSLELNGLRPSKGACAVPIPSRSPNFMRPRTKKNTYVVVAWMKSVCHMLSTGFGKKWWRDYRFDCRFCCCFTLNMLIFLELI